MITYGDLWGQELGIIPSLNIMITLRCNGYCKNCVEFCCRQEDTGLDYFDSDMTVGQIDNFIREVRSSEPRIRFSDISITGGESLLHPDVVEITQKVIQLREYYKRFWVDSNLSIVAPASISRYIENSSLPKDNYKIHQVSLLHPSEFGSEKRTRQQCVQRGKTAWVLNYQGFSLCSMGDAFIRLFGREDMILDHLPTSFEDFGNIDEICEHCSWSRRESLPFERDVGNPVSLIYQEEAKKNKLGRKINKRYPEI